MPSLTTPPRFRTADDDVAAATDRRRTGDHRLGRRLPRERWDFGVGSGRVADEFVPGRALSSAFYAEVVAPLLHARPHSAALLGWGSDVLGFDTTVSTDHGWGPRMHVFVGPSDVDAVRRDLAAGLPEQFRGWPERFGWDGVPTQHHVQVSTLTDWLHNHLGVDPQTGMTPLDWLLLPQQALLEATRGQVHADHNGQLGRVRALLAWFPPQVHRWLLACQWERIAQEEAFVGRAAQAGDDLGSRLITARLIRQLMRLAFLLSREYWPYPKWFGTAFARLPIAPELAPPLQRALEAARYPARETALVEAYGVLARAHNATGVTPHVDPQVRPYYDRPFLVLGAGRFADACRRTVTDNWLGTLPLLGSVDQLADSADLLASTDLPSRHRAPYHV
jgi:hypothetical protein